MEGSSHHRKNLQEACRKDEFNWWKITTWKSIHCITCAICKYQSIFRKLCLVDVETPPDVGGDGNCHYHTRCKFEEMLGLDRSWWTHRRINFGRVSYHSAMHNWRWNFSYQGLINQAPQPPKRLGEKLQNDNPLIFCKGIPSLFHWNVSWGNNSNIEKQTKMKTHQIKETILNLRTVFNYKNTIPLPATQPDP